MEVQPKHLIGREIQTVSCRSQEYLGLRKLSDGVQAWDSKPEDNLNTVAVIHTCHHGLVPPIPHHGKQHNMDLFYKGNHLSLRNWYFSQGTSKQETEREHKTVVKNISKKQERTCICNDTGIAI